MALEMLKILEGFDLQKMGAQSTDALHLMIEAKKLAFADRDRHLADRDFMKLSVTELFSPKRVTNIRSQIQLDKAASEYAPAATGTDTEYVAAADREGNLVSFIQSNFMGFGSGVVEPETAIILQNRGHLFSLDENHPTVSAPHKRCVHTLMPGLIFKDGKPYGALGLKGGHVQPQVQVQIDFQSHRLPHDAAGSDLGAAIQSYRGDKSRTGARHPPSVKDELTPAATKSSAAIPRASAAPTRFSSIPIRRLRRRLGPAQGRVRVGILSSRLGFRCAASGLQDVQTVFCNPLVSCSPDAVKRNPGALVVGQR